MSRHVPLFLVLGALLPGCDSRQALEKAQLARFPQGQIFEDLESPRHAAQRGLPACLRVDVPVIGRGVCVPVEPPRPDGARDALRFGVWTYEYVKAEQTTSPDGQVRTHYGGLEDTSLGLEARGEYVKNKHHGPWTFWHLNGKTRATGTFVEDEMSGEWKFWLADGAVDSIHSGVYEHDVRKSDSPPK